MILSMFAASGGFNNEMLWWMSAWQTVTSSLLITGSLYLVPGVPPESTDAVFFEVTGKNKVTYNLNHVITAFTDPPDQTLCYYALYTWNTWERRQQSVSGCVVSGLEERRSVTLLTADQLRLQSWAVNTSQLTLFWCIDAEEQYFTEI